jgi:hypothetical protein
VDVPLKALYTYPELGRLAAHIDDLLAAPLPR